MACPSPKLLLLDSARWARARAVVRPKRRVGVQSRARGFSPAPPDSGRPDGAQR